jgi:large repetitive protein
MISRKRARRLTQVMLMGAMTALVVLVAGWANALTTTTATDLSPGRIKAESAQVSIFGVKMVASAAGDSLTGAQVQFTKVQNFTASDLALNIDAANCSVGNDTSCDGVQLWRDSSKSGSNQDTLDAADTPLSTGFTFGSNDCTTLTVCTATLTVTSSTVPTANVAEANYTHIVAIRTSASIQHDDTFVASLQAGAFTVSPVTTATPVTTTQNIAGDVISPSAPVTSTLGLSTSVGAVRVGSTAVSTENPATLEVWKSTDGDCNGGDLTQITTSGEKDLTDTGVDLVGGANATQAALLKTFPTSTHTVCYRITDEAGNSSNFVGDGTVPAAPSTSDIALLGASNVTGVKRIHALVDPAGPRTFRIYLRPGGTGLDRARDQDSLATHLVQVTTSTSAETNSIGIDADDPTTDIRALGTGNSMAVPDGIAYSRVNGAGNDGPVTSDGSVPATPSAGDLNLLYTTAVSGRQRVAAAADPNSPQTFALYMDPLGLTTWSSAVTSSGGSTQVKITTGASATTSGTTAIYGGSAGTTQLSGGDSIGYAKLSAAGNESNVAADGTIPEDLDSGTISFSDASNTFTVSPFPVGAGDTSVKVRLFVGDTQDAAYVDGHDGEATSATPATVTSEFDGGKKLFYTAINLASGNESTIIQDGTIPSPPASGDMALLRTSAADGHQRIAALTDTSQPRIFRLYVDTAGGTSYTRAATMSGGSSPVQVTTSSSATTSGTTTIFAGTTQLTGTHAVAYSRVVSDGTSSNDSDPLGDGTIPAAPVASTLSLSDAQGQMIATGATSSLPVNLFIGAASDTASLAYDETGPDFTASNSDPVSIGDPASASTLYYTINNASTGNESRTTSDGAVPAPPTSDLSLLATSAVTGYQRVIASSDPSPGRIFRLYVDTGGGTAWKRAVATSGGTSAVQVTTTATGSTSGTTTLFGGPSGDVPLTTGAAIGYTALSAEGNDSDVAADGTIPAPPSAATTEASAAADSVSASGASPTSPVSVYRSTSSDSAVAYGEGAELTLDTDTTDDLDLAVGDYLYYQVINASTGNQSLLTADGLIPAAPSTALSSVSAALDQMDVPGASATNNVRIFLDPSNVASDAYDNGPDYTAVASPKDAVGGIPAEYVYYTALDVPSGNESTMVSDGSVPAAPTSIAGVMSASIATNSISANIDSSDGPRTIRLYGNTGTGLARATTTAGGSTNIELTTSAGSQTTLSLTAPEGIFVAATQLAATHTVGYSRLVGGNESDVVADGIIPAAPTLTSAFEASAADQEASLGAALLTGSYRLFRNGLAASGRTPHTLNEANTLQITTPLTDGDSVSYSFSNSNGNESATLADGTIPATPVNTLQAASDTGRTDDDGVTADPTPTFTIAGTTGGEVTMFEGGIILADPVTMVLGAGQITTNALSNATHTIQSKLKLDGNTSPASAASTVTVDTVVPTTPAAPDLLASSDNGVSSTDNETNDPTPTFGVTTEDDADVDILNTATVVGSAISNGDGLAQVTTSALTPDGVFTLTARVTDLAGNVSTIGAGLAVTIDTVAPTALAPGSLDLVAASDSGRSAVDNITNDATPTIAVSGTVNGDLIGLSESGTTVASGTANGTNPFELTTSTLGQGAHSIVASIIDTAGNQGATSSALSLTVDTVAPTAGTPNLVAGSDLGRSSTDDITKDNTPTITSTSEALADTDFFDGATPLASNDANNSGLATITAAAMSDGVHAITATATDVAGNVSAASSGLSITVDTGVPVTPSALDLQTDSDTGTSTTDNITSDATPAFDVTVAEADGLVSVKNGATEIGTAIGTGTVAVTSSTLSNGAKTITATVADIAGNVSAAISGLSVTIDTAAPAAPAKPDLQSASDTGSSSTDNITTDTTPSMTVTAAESGMLLKLKEGETLVDSATPAGTSATITAATLAEGSHTFTATATDVAGNVSAASSALTVIIDNSLPTAVIATPATLASKPTVTFSEGVTPVTSSNVVIRLDGSSTNLAGTVAYNTTSHVATISTTSPLIPGQNYVILVSPASTTPAHDAAGNDVAMTQAAFRASLTEQDNSIGVRPAWRNVSTGSAYGSSYRLERHAGGTVSFAFTGTSVTWYTVTGTSMGKATVKIDGVSKGTIDNYATSTHYKVARTFSGLSPNSHTILITVAGTKRSAASDTRVAVDAFRVGAGSIVGSTAKYAWPRIVTASASGGSYTRTDNVTATISFTFRGTGIDWYTVTGGSFGKAEVFIDNVSKGIVDNYSASTTYNVKRDYTVADGVHTIVIKVLGTKNASATAAYVAVDKFVVT